MTAVNTAVWYIWKLTEEIRRVLITRKHIFFLFKMVSFESLVFYAFVTLSREGPQASLTAKGVHYRHVRDPTCKFSWVLSERSQVCSHLEAACCFSARSSLLPVTWVPDTLFRLVSIRVSPHQRRLTWLPMQNYTAHAIAPLYLHPCTCSAPLTRPKLTEHGERARAFHSLLLSPVTSPCRHDHYQSHACVFFKQPSAKS